MTAEEFSEAADRVFTPAIACLTQFAFQTVKQENVETLVVSYLDMMKEVAVESVRSIIADARSN